MKMCPWKLPDGSKCAEPHENSNSYCAAHRNEYMRNYQRERKDHPFRYAATGSALGCDACGVSLKSNNVQRIETESESVVLCSACYATVNYMTKTLELEQYEYLVGLVRAIRNPPKPKPRAMTYKRYDDMTAEEKAVRDAYYAEVEAKFGPKPRTVTEPVAPGPGNFRPCGACDNEARAGYKFCEACKEFEEDSAQDVSGAETAAEEKAEAGAEEKAVVDSL